MAMTQQEMEQLLGTQSIQTSNSELTSYKSTSDKGYAQILKHANVTSYSQLEEFYRCPRKFQKRKEQAAFGVEVERNNIDFAFGHAVGAGVQNYLITKDLNKALFNCMMGWNIEFDADNPKKKKSLWCAMLAVEQFANRAMEELLDEYELLYLPSGKPAIEVSFSLHCGNGFKHYLHMDIGMRHKRTGRVAVIDCKTTGFGQPEEALYANSTQALSYSILLETALQEELTNYEVFYMVFSSTEREWQMLPFTKSALEQAEYIKDLLLTQDTIKTYRELKFFPKRGQACYDFRRRCEYYGECNMTADQELPWMEDQDEAEEADYIVDLRTVIARLKQRKQENAA